MNHYGYWSEKGSKDNLVESDNDETKTATDEDNKDSKGFEDSRLVRTGNNEVKTPTEGEVVVETIWILEHGRNGISWTNQPTGEYMLLVVDYFSRMLFDKAYNEATKESVLDSWTNYLAAIAV